MVFPFSLVERLRATLKPTIEDDTMKTFPIVLATALISLVGAAHAQPQMEVEQRVVHFGDLDLSEQDDAKALYRRIARAARDVCGGAPDWTISMSVRSRTCRAAATGRAVADVDAPLLTQYFASRGGVIPSVATQVTAAIRVERGNKE
jgi:UrcA family protein